MVKMRLLSSSHDFHDHSTANTRGKVMGVNFRHLLTLLLGFFILLAQTPAFAVTSDDFSSPELNASIWTAINPRSDATFTIEGSGTPDSALVINVPAGTDHDVWLVNMAPRIMQAAANEDLDIEVKFQSSLTSQYQIQGVIVEQDSSNYMRFDFVRDNLGTRVYAASFSNGSASVKSNVSIINGNPLYLRINRTGNQWTESYSYNGTNWTTAGSFAHTLAVASIGPFAGNAGNPAPAFTSRIDYFFNTASPIVPEDGEDIYPPVVNIWYGTDQLFGYNGIPQAWVNILGNVSDNSGIAALSYRLNGGLQVSLTIGPDGKRLQSAGDFNIDIAYSALSCGANPVDISATDTFSNVTTERVNVFYFCNTYWPRTYSIDWGAVANIQDAAQVVDGLWSIESSSIRPVIQGYDRLIAIGDIDPTWKDYEVTVPITLNAPLNSSVPYGPIFGIIIHWQGHYDWDGTQPRWGWWPLGAMGIYDWVPQNNDFRLRIVGNAESSIAEDLSGRHLSVGVPYIFKMRAETVSNKSVYSLKVWEADTPEPSGWNLSGQGISAGLKHGSLLLLSHYADVSFGNVSICNDSSASINPESSKADNGVDDNCNGQVDEGLPTPITDDPPIILNLSEPANGAIDMPTTLTLKWEIPTDTPGDSITYKLHIGTDPGLEDVTPIIVAAASTNNNTAMAMRYSLGMFGLLGIIAVGGLSKTGKRTGLLIIPIIMMTGVILTSCGSIGTGHGNGNQEPDVSKGYKSYKVTLQPNTTYYWKVVADNNKESVVESDIFSFKTGQ